MTARAILYPHPDPEHVRKNLDRLASLDADARTATWLRLFGTLLRGRLDRLGGTRPALDPAGRQQRARRARRRGGRARGRRTTPGQAGSPMPEDVVVAAGSCGTAAGLVARVRARARAGARRRRPGRAQARRAIGARSCGWPGAVSGSCRAGMGSGDEVVLGAAGRWSTPKQAGGYAQADARRRARRRPRATTAGVAGRDDLHREGLGAPVLRAPFGPPSAVLEHFRRPD